MRISNVLHPGQRLVHDSSARFKVVCGGRRWGKSRLGLGECLDVGVKGGKAWWVAPTYKIGEIGWRPLRNVANRAGFDVSVVNKQVFLPGGGWVQVRSADNPDGLRGEGLDFIVMDEAAYILEEAWANALRPALSDREGGALFISTPSGMNWFYSLWLRGQTGEKGWESWQFPTSSNPYISAEEIAQAKKDLSIRDFEQEYLALFISDGTTVFRNLDSCLGAELKTCRQGSYEYYFGVDLGRSVDFTAISVLERKPTGEINQCYLERFTDLSYLFQLERLKTLNSKFRPVTILIERNSMGQPFLELCGKERLPVEGFTTTSLSKKELIEGLSLALEREELRLLDDEIQLNELRSFGIEKLPGGTIRYAALSGHDDTVIALGLSYFATLEDTTASHWGVDPFANYRG